jgi:cytochrome P450
MRLPPGPPTRLFGLAAYPAFSGDRIGALARLAKEYGDVVLFRLGRQRMALLNHPDHVEDVLVTRARLFKKGRALERAKGLLGEGLLTAEGEAHLRQRRLVQPSFHRQRVEGYAQAMVAHAARSAERWRDGGEIDVAAEMTQLTLTIVGDTLFGADVGGDAQSIRQALTDVFEIFPITMSPLGPLLEHLPLPVVRRSKRARATLDRIIYRIIDERRRTSADRGDLLSMLLLAQDEEQNGARMTDTQVRDEAMTLFLAGHETTANALTWTWHLLAQHPDVERRLHEELDTVVGDRLPRADDAASLPYTRRVLSEVMRCYPPAWGIGRRAIEDVEIGGYTIPRGTVVLMSQYLLHHDARFFPEPERFDPDRWLPERQRTRPRFAYFPFGGGNRVCIGESFAWTEGILVLATLARHWRLERVETAPVPMKAMLTLRPARPIRMKLTRRSGGSENPADTVGAEKSVTTG